MNIPWLVILLVGLTCHTTTPTTTPLPSSPPTATPTATATPLPSSTPTTTQSVNGTKWEQFACRPCTDCVQAMFSLASSMDTFSIPKLCTALSTLAPVDLSGYTKCEEETCLQTISSSTNTSAVAMQFRGLPNTGASFSLALNTVIGDGTLSAALVAAGAPALVVGTATNGSAYAVGVNLTVTNHPTGAKPPYVNTQPAWEIRAVTNSRLNPSDKVGLPLNGWVSISFPSEIPLGSPADMQVEVDCEPRLNRLGLGYPSLKCTGWTAAQTFSGASIFSVNNGVTLKMDFSGTNLPGNIEDGDTLIVRLREGVNRMPLECTSLAHWMYIVRTGQGDDQIMYFAGNPTDDHCMDLCNSCQEIYDSTYLCHIHDEERGWMEYHRGPWEIPTCQRCSTSGVVSNMWSRRPEEPVTGACSQY
uniref:C2H2-type domain-containing protein n=1 Tax=Eutreptiella gymnastica TaxID=73025 RepID=A0A7S1ILZ2_9EUGL